MEKTLQASNKNIEKDITSIEKIMHDACNEAIPNYNKSIRTKSTGKSLWNKGIKIYQKYQRLLKKIMPYGKMEEHQKTKIIL